MPSSSSTPTPPPSLRQTLLALLALLPALLPSRCLAQSFQSRPRCPSAFAWIRDPSDCRHFWRCNWGTALEMPRCPDGTVLSDRFHVCVHTGSIFDDCSPIPTVLPGTPPDASLTTTTTPTRFTFRPSTPTQTPRPTPTTPATSPPTTSPVTVSVYEHCARNNTGLMAHPSECQLYFNCSLESGVVPRAYGVVPRAYGVVPGPYEHYLSECAYPLLYEERSQTCEQAWRVDCKGRRKPATECHYRTNPCNNPAPATPPPTTTPPTPVSSLPFSVYEYCARNSTDLIPHPEQCQLYYNCSWSYDVVPRFYEHYLSECAYPLLYDEQSQTCQPEWRVECGIRRKPATACDYRNHSCNSPAPTTPPRALTTTPAWPFSIIEYCSRNSTALIPHPEECQLFYNCSQFYDVVPQYLEQYLQECLYPRVYDVRQQKCGDFWEVDCMGKKEPVTACDYRQYRCSGPSCTPCDEVMPSCVGRGDGLQPAGQGPWTATYVTCRTGRTVNTTQCSPDTALNVPRVFSPLALKCVNLYHVPKEAGGLRPECGGRPDGTYPEDSDRHDLFYVCKGGHFGGIFRCPQRRPFYDAEAKVCVSRSG